MKKIVIIALFLAICGVLQAQSNKSNEVIGANPTHSFEELDEKPEFPGGTDGLVKYLSENITYPKKAQQNGVEGKVMVQFVVSKKGKITRVEVLRGVEKSLDKAAVKVIKAMPLWKPGSVGGNAVDVIYSLPIVFKLS